MAPSHSIRLLDLSFASPEENLACDEALLSICEKNGGAGILRFWEPREPFVVVGYTNAVESEVNVDRCHEEGVPVFRRITGGGAVAQGYGCLDYTLVLPVTLDQALESITGTNMFVMKRMREAVASMMPAAYVTVEGDTDLVVDGSKVAGNAQRRGTRWVLFHGVFLVSFDLLLLERLLPMPTRQPRYRNNRSHTAFVRNLGVSTNGLKCVLGQQWNAEPGQVEVPETLIQRIVNTRYALPSWNYRR